MKTRLGIGIWVLASWVHAGPLVAIGGGLTPENEAVYRTIIELAGTDPTLCIFGTASSDPQDSAEAYVADFATYGATAEVVDITTENAATSTRDDAVVAAIRGCDGYFFTGGDQRRITEALLDNGEDTPALTALRERFAAGAPVVGTSAGLAAMSDPMISGGVSVDTLLSGPDPVTLEPGLGFTDVLLDQHSVERGRFGRLLGALFDSNSTLGVGVSEDTAVVIPETGPWRVIGAGYVVVLEVPVDSTLETPKGVEMSLISSGDTFDPETSTFNILEGRSADEVGTYYDPGTIFAVDIFGPEVVGDVLKRLIDSPEMQASGLGFLGSNEASFSADGVRLVFEKTERTQGYWGRVDGEDYSVVRVGVRLEPVEVSVSPRGSN
ncbi:hypothetical protein BH24DEI2_BH24DEI2_21010 [soil metagenome]